MESMGISEDQIPRLTEKLFDDQAKSLAALSAKYQKPLIGFTFQSPEELSIQKMLAQGIPVLPSPERAARAMAALVNYSRLVAKIRQGQERSGISGRPCGEI
jgi:acyl-CoA synthetase (NDP forming)